jgi:rare lipoprotein A
MKISNLTVRTFGIVAVSAGLLLPAGFGPARAVESTDTNRGTGDQTKTHTAPSHLSTGSSASESTPSTPSHPTAHLTKTSASAACKKKATPSTASRSGLRVGRRKVLTGVASFYGGRFHGRRTFTGERFNQYAMTLACRRLPMGTRVRVTNLRNGKSVVGRVNDRGPNGRFRSRVADLSKGMARKIGLTDGLTRVRLEVLDK